MVIPDYPARLRVPNPFLSAPTIAWLEFVRTQPLAYGATLGLHAFALLDQDFPFTYNHDLQPWYRWPISVCGYLFVSAAIFGTGLALSGRAGALAPWRRRLPIAALALAAVLALAVYLPTHVEIRSSTPVYPLLTPGFVLGLQALLGLVRLRQWRAIGLCLVIAAVLVFGSALLASWLRSQALLCDLVDVCTPLAAWGK